MINRLFLFAVMLQLVACGGPVTSRRTAEHVQLDTLTFRTELDSALTFFRTGRTEEADSVLRPILRATDGVPELRKQQLNALSIRGLILQRNSRPDSALRCYQRVLAIAVAAGDTFWMGSAHTNLGVVRPCA